MSSTLQMRIDFLGHKFAGNRRLAEEFEYFQDPNVKKLEKWQKWKLDAVKDDRWTSWQTEDRAKQARGAREPFRDPFLPRRKARRRQRAEKGLIEYDVGREVVRVEVREKSRWQRQTDEINTMNSPIKNGPKMTLPPKPPKLLSFARVEDKVPIRHWLDPSPFAVFPMDPLTGLPPLPPAELAKRAKKKKPNFARPDGVKDALNAVEGGDGRATGLGGARSTKGSSAGSGPGSAAGSGASTPRGSTRSGETRGSTAAAQTGPQSFAANNNPMEEVFDKFTPLTPWAETVYRFRVWWLGYMAAVTVQRAVRGWRSRAWLRYRVLEPRALRRRQAVYAIQRVYRGHIGRKAYFHRRLQRTSAAIFIQRAVRHFSHVRDLDIARRRNKAARKLQLAWYKLNSILLSTRVRALVQNKKDAVSAKVGTTAMYYASLRMQVLCVRWLARTRFRKLRAMEKRAATMVQALARGMFARRTTDAVVGAAIAAMRQGRQASMWALTKMVMRFVHRTRHRKHSEMVNRMATFIQKIYRGHLARNLDTRLRVQHKLVRGWVTDFKNERVGPLTDSTEVKDFYLTLEPRHRPPPRMERHAKTSLVDLPWTVRNGPLFENEIMVPDYARQYADRASRLLKDQAYGGGPSLTPRSPAPRPRTPPPKPLRVGVTVEPSAPAHALLLLASPHAKVAVPLSAVDLLDGAVDSLDDALSRRMRTVSRGLPASAGLPKEWDADTGDGERGRSAQRSRDASRARGEAVEASVEHSSKFKAQERPEFGALHVVLDKKTCRHKGETEVKDLDARSKALLVAADRKSHGGVAPFKGNVRTKRTAGASKIIAAALQIISVQNKERGIVTNSVPRTASL